MTGCKCKKGACDKCGSACKKCQCDCYGFHVTGRRGRPVGSKQRPMEVEPRVRESRRESAMQAQIGITACVNELEAADVSETRITAAAAPSAIPPSPYIQGTVVERLISNYYDFFNWNGDGIRDLPSLYQRMNLSVDELRESNPKGYSTVRQCILSGAVDIAEAFSGDPGGFLEDLGISTTAGTGTETILVSKLLKTVVERSEKRH